MIIKLCQIILLQRAYLFAIIFIIYVSSIQKLHISTHFDYHTHTYNITTSLDRTICTSAHTNLVSSSNQLPPLPH